MLNDPEFIAEWISRKGVSVWPSLPFADTSDPVEAKKLAEWFSDQMVDLQAYWNHRTFGFPYPPEQQ